MEGFWIRKLLMSLSCLHGYRLRFITLDQGNETKLGMSRGAAEPKLTNMDAMIDKLTGAIFIFQIVVVIVLGIDGNIWKNTEARKVSTCKSLICFPHMVDLETGTSANATL